jgi:drug/metabolite transporter (DMT)-like permease
LERRHLYLIIASFAAIYIIWGSTYLFVKIAISEIPPFLMAGMRFAFAGLLIFLIRSYNYKNWKITKPQIINSLFAGFLFLTVGNGGVSWSLKYVDSGFAALIIAAQPLVMLIMMWLIDRKPILPRSWVGIVLGIFGVFLLVSQNELVSSQDQWLGVAIIFLCLVSWGYASLYVAKADLPESFFLNTGIQMVSAGFSMVCISYLIGESVPEWSSISIKVWSSISFLVVFGSIVAFTAFNFLLKYVSPEKVATSTYINPIIALVLGWLVLNETITAQSIIAASILLIGVYFINFNKGRRITRT